LQDEIITHRTKRSQISELVNVVNAKVKIDDLLHALMEENLTELAETLENEYNSNEPTVRACWFKEPQPSCESQVQGRSASPPVRNDLSPELRKMLQIYVL